MTYDEGFIDVLANAWPIHQRYKIPGHLDVVAGQLGQRRHCYLSSMNGLFHAGVEHLRFLISEGWSVGNHSWSHFVYPTQAGLDLHREVIYSKYYLEDKLGAPITFFAIPNDKFNYEPALPFIKQAGYLGCQYIDGGVNHDDVDLLKIGNFMVASGKLRATYDWPDALLTPNLAIESLQDGWLCETTHLVQPHPIQDWKNIAADDLEKRFAKLIAITRGKLWAATPEEVIDYILLRRSASIQPASGGAFTLVMEWPLGVSKRQLSLQADDPGARIRQVFVNRKELAFRREPGSVVFTIADLEGTGPWDIRLQ